MAPTRELAQQIDQQMEGFSYFMPVSSVAVYGGNDGVLFEQQKGLTLGDGCCNRYSGTSDSSSQSGICRPVASPISFWMKQTVCSIWDFYDDIMQIVKFLALRSVRPLCFRLQMPAKIQQLAQNILHNPVEVKLAVSNLPKNMQAAYICYENQNWVS